MDGDSPTTPLLLGIIMIPAGYLMLRYWEKLDNCLRRSHGFLYSELSPVVIWAIGAGWIALGIAFVVLGLLANFA